MRLALDLEYLPLVAPSAHERFLATGEPTPRGTGSARRLRVTRARFATGVLLGWISLGGCATLPDLTYGDASVSQDSDAEPVTADATLVDASAIVDGTVLPAADALAVTDATADVMDAGNMDDAAGDDSGDPPGPLTCEGGTVSACAQCPGAPLRCKSACVATCDQCPGGGNWVPCFRCPAKNTLKEVCVQVGAGGQAQCPGNLCACDSSADCPAVPGESVLCALDSMTNSNRCLACGAQGTNGLTCVLLDGGEGTCHVAPKTDPSCL